MDVHTIAEEIATQFVGQTAAEAVEHQSTVAVVRLELPDGRRFKVHVEEGFRREGPKGVSEGLMP